jgi:hypothetical protein
MLMAWGLSGEDVQIKIQNLRASTRRNNTNERIGTMIVPERTLNGHKNALFRTLNIFRSAFLAEQPVGDVWTVFDVNDVYLHWL